jgi:RNA polymerase sigma factor (sigma-70 family)
VEHFNDDVILEGIRKNDNSVLRVLYKRHYPMIVNLVCTNSGTEQEAKDVFQEAMIAFYERVGDPAFSLTCKIKTYLYAVCRRLWLKRLSEKKRTSVPIAEVESFAGIEEEMVSIEAGELQMKRMEDALGSLGEPCRAIIEDFYMRDLSMEMISEKFGYTNADNAKNQKYKCLQRLKKLFFKESLNS